MKLTEKTLIFSLEDAPVTEHHASTLAMLPDGRIAAAWFGGTKEKNPDVEIWCSLRTTDGRWTKPSVATVPGHIACWNPVLYHDGTVLRLFFKRGEGIADPPWATWTKTAEITEDGTFLWSEEHELVPGDVSGGRGPVKDKPILLSDGTLLAGASHEYTDGRWLAFADRSSDAGKTWERSAYFETEPGVGLIQPTLWEDEKGVHALMRSNKGYIYRADSRDLGKTWSRAYPTSLSNNNSGIDLVKFSARGLALVCNPVCGNWAKRTPLSLFLSQDNGETWERTLDLETADGEFSYPAVITDGKRLYCTFTYLRRSIMFAVIEL